MQSVCWLSDRSVVVRSDEASGSLSPELQILDAVDTEHFGEALQSPDLTAVWGFRVLLQRDFQSVSEYQDAVDSLPNLVLGARGPRARFATDIATSP